MRKNKTKQRLTAMMLSVIMVVGMMPVSAQVETGTFPIGASGEITSFEALGSEIAMRSVPLGTSQVDLKLPDILVATIRLAASEEEPVLDSGETDGDLESADMVNGSAIGIDEIDDTEDGEEAAIAINETYYCSEPLTLMMHLGSTMPVCEIAGEPYDTLDAAIAAVETGGSTPTTIKLLDNITYISTLMIDNKNIIFDNNSFTFEIISSDDRNGLIANYGAKVVIAADITTTDDSGKGVYAYDGAEVTVMGDITATGDSGIGVYANGAKVTVAGNIEADDLGVAAYDGAEVTVTGDITAMGDSGKGVYANGAKVTVAGNIEADDTGVAAYSSAEVTVTGDITATDEYGKGVNAHDDAEVTITGNIDADYSGVEAYDSAEVTVTGDLTATGDSGIGVYAVGAVVTVTGNIEASEGGIYAYDGAGVTVDGEISADTEVTIDSSVVDLVYGRQMSSSKPGYYEYGGGTTKVWVKMPYAISLSVAGTHTFDSATYGYASAPDALTVTVTNLGRNATGALTAALTAGVESSFTITDGSISDIAVGGSATFTVAPKVGLAVGNHNETLTVSTDHSTNATVSLSFSVTAIPTYIVTFNPNGGMVSEASRSVAPGTAVGTLPTPTRSSSYSFDGWYTVASGGTQISASTTVSANVTYYAHWTYTGGGGSGSGGRSSSSDNSSAVIITPPAPDKPNSPTQSEIKVSGTVDGKGNVTASITEKTVSDAFDKALAEAKKSGTEQNGITVVLRLETGNKTGSNVTINLPKAVQDAIIAKKIVSIIIVVDNPDIRIGMDLAAVQELNKQAKSDVNIIATRMNSDKLTGDAKKAIGNRPVFDLKVNYGNGKAVSSFGAGSVSITIPYTLGVNEKAGNVQAVYVDSKGKVHWLVNSVYDSLEKVLRFSTNHFSTYGIGYKKTNSVFTDIAGHWAKEDIEFVVSRGLFSGTSETKFSPNTVMTRGMFVTALGRLANADVSGYAKSSFSDVKDDAYYMGYIEWASKNNIVNGVGNGKFAPDQSIAREQMAVIMSNYAKTIGYTLPKVHVENIFADNAKTSTYAKEAVKQMQMAGVISGKNGNLFDPQGAATRAEVSAVLRCFVELAISSNTD